MLPPESRSRPKPHRRQPQLAHAVARAVAAVHHAAAAPVQRHATHAVARAVLASRPVQRTVHRATHAKFHAEGPSHYHAAYRQNRRYAKPGPYQTPLPAPAERAFRRWVARHDVPFDVHARKVDYDMRGYYAAGGAGHGLGVHFPDTYKTPYDTTFSAESKYALPGAPFVWRNGKLYDRRTGRLIFGP